MVDLAALPIALPPDAEPWQALAAVVRSAPAGEPAVWLDSACARPGLGEWSFAFVGPPRAAWAAATPEDGARLLEGPLPAALAGLRGGAAPEAWRAARARLGIPLAGGAAVVLGYDLGRAFERVRPPPAGVPAARRDDAVPIASAWLFPHVLACEVASGRLVLAGAGAGFEAARARVEAALARAADPAGLPRPAPAPPARRAAAEIALRRGFTASGYERAVALAKDLIRAGDIFEVNLAQRFEAPLVDGDDALAAYLRVRAAAPAPFAAFVQAGGWALLSASPERFLRVADRAVEARPIKGTRPRGASPEADRRALAELIGSPKDNAELAMIVDLLRNDLGRVARPGGVRVVEAAEPIAFPQVHHLVGHIAADLMPGTTSLDAIRAAFPCGSITGAPKPRAMEVIDLLEPVRRGPYTGSLGWVGADLDADLSVVIRTIVLEGRQARFSVGGAVTIDSDPAAEHEETLVKGRALARALGLEL